MQIMHMQSIFDCVQSNLIGPANRLATTNTAARHPHRKAIGVMVATVSFFAHRCSSELAAPNHECTIQQPSLLEIFQKARNRLVARKTHFAMVLFDGRMRIPLATCTVI